MDLSYNVLWFEDTDESFDTLNRRTRRYVETKNLVYNVKRIVSGNDFNVSDYDLNKYEVLIVDLKLANSTFGYDIIRNVREGNYVNDVLFYSAEGEAGLIQTMKDYGLEGVFVSERDHKKLMPKLELLIDKSIRRAENVINIRGIVMDVTSEFDNLMVEIITLSDGLLTDDNKNALKNYTCKELLGDRRKTIEELHNKYSGETEWSFSDLLQEREFTSMMKARLLNKFFNLDNETIKSLKSVFDDHIPNAYKDDKCIFYNYYNERILTFRNALAHIKNGDSSSGSVFIKRIGDQDYYCDTAFCSMIRTDLISLNSFFRNIYSIIEAI